MIDKYTEVFAEGLGTLEGVTVALYVDPQARPRFHKARPISYAYREKVDMELERLQREGVLEPVEFSQWAIPVVRTSFKRRMAVSGSVVIIEPP